MLLHLENLLFLWEKKDGFAKSWIFKFAPDCFYITVSGSYPKLASGISASWMLDCLLCRCYKG